MLNPWAKHTVQQNMKFNIWPFPDDFFSCSHCIMGQQLIHVSIMWVVYFHFCDNRSHMRFCPCQSSHKHRCLPKICSNTCRNCCLCPCVLLDENMLSMLSGLDRKTGHHWSMILPQHIDLCHLDFSGLTKTGRQPPNLVWALTTNMLTSLSLAAFQIKS